MEFSEFPGDAPGVEQFDGSASEYELSDFEEVFGLETLGVVNLKGEDPIRDIVTNAPISSFILEANTDGDELILFLPDGDSPDTPDGEGVQITSDTENKTITTGLFDDTITATADGAVINSGAGADQIVAEGDNATIDTGAGNDTITASGLASIAGGSGDDMIVSTSAAPSFVNGGDGNDTISTFAYDFRLEGGAGDDQLVAAGGGEINGGAGNDLFVLGTDFRDALETIVIEEFTPGEDRLVVPIGENAEGEWTVSVLRDADQDVTFVTVRNPADEAEFSVEIGVNIALQGAPDITEADILLTLPAAAA